MASEKALSEAGERIRAALNNRPVTWLAKEANVSRGVINDAMAGTFPSADKAVRIAEALGVSVEYLFAGRPLAAPPGSAVAGAQQVLREVAARQFDPVHRPRPIPGKGEPSAYDRAALTFDQATRIARWEPPEAVRVALMQILFRHDIEAESIALLLEAVSPGEDVF